MMKQVFSRNSSRTDESCSFEEDSEHDKCSIRESPLRILRVAEYGSVEEFKRMIKADVEKLQVRDKKGRSATHHAALKNRAEILKIILEFKGDFNVLDIDGYSPLHLAVNAEAVDSINFLLQNGADPNVLNKKRQSALHIAAALGKVKSLKEFVNCYLVDVNQPGDQGRTPLHLACIHDQFECVKILVEELNASPRRACSYSYLPIHEAAKCGSVRALESLFRSGAKSGFPKKEMITFPDDEGNLALHLAVQSGDAKTVLACLECGSKISAVRKDLSTAVHLACAQGSMDIVKLMFDLQPEERIKSLSARDVEGMTPLHYAAMFGHTELVEYLADQESPLDPLNKSMSSPLHLAASKNAWKSIKVLVSYGADVTIKDSRGKTILHTLAEHNGDLEQIVDNETIVWLIPLLRAKDKNGNTALHISAKNGQIKWVNQLVNLGSSITAKNSDGDTVFNIACRCGEVQVIETLSKHPKFFAVLNEGNNKGWTPFHVAAGEGNLRVLEFLLKKGILLHKDYDGQTPLHVAAANGYKEVVNLLLRNYSHLIDAKDNEGNTALHSAAFKNQPKVADLLLRRNCQLLYNNDGYSAIDLAIMSKFVEVAHVMVTQHDRGYEVLGQTEGKYPCIMEALVAKFPVVAKAILDKGIRKCGMEKQNSSDYFIEYSFKWLEKPFSADGRKNKDCLPILNEMANHERVSLLSHELSLKYLDMKWNAYGKFFQYSSFFFYLIYLGLVTFIATNDSQKDPDFYIRWNWFNKSAQTAEASCFNPKFLDIADFSDEAGKAARKRWNEVHKTDPDYIEDDHFLRALLSVIALWTVFNLIVEAISIRRHGCKYCQNIDTWSWIVMNISCFIATDRVHVHFSQHFDNPSWTVACFTGWFYLLLMMQRFEAVGLYVSMFLEILKTLFRVLVIFFILIIAFALAFYVLLSNGNHTVFSSIPMSIMRTFSMMLGDLDFMNTFLYPHHCNDMEQNNRTGERLYTNIDACLHPRRIPHPYATFPMVCVYMVFMPIVMINLLIGLAVGDIGLVRKNAQLKRLSMKVQIHTNIEKLLPEFVLRRLNKHSVVEHPNKTGKRFPKYFEERKKQEADEGHAVVGETDRLLEAVPRNSTRLASLSSDLDNIKSWTSCINMALMKNKGNN